MTGRTERFTAEAEDNGQRLDQVLARRIPGLSRRKARVLVDIGGVFIDRARVKVASRPVRAGQVVEAHMGGALDRASGVGSEARDREQAQLPPFEIVFEDDDVIVVDKPAGLVTAPTPESDRGNLLDALTRRPGAGRVYLVHRIDLPTSGLLVFAKTDVANRVLGARFAVHDIEREYRAVVARRVEAEAFTIDRPIRGKRAVTHVAVLERFAGRGGESGDGGGIGAGIEAGAGDGIESADGSGPGAGDGSSTLISARLETGRSHQIRIHLAGERHPLLGDAEHGGERARLFRPRPPRLALHAAVLGFAHPRTGAPMRFERPIPDDLAQWIERLRGAGGA